MKGVLNWFDTRFGCRTLLRELLEEHLPGGPGWRHVWGRVVVLTFLVQVITGLALWAFYSPSIQSAWESVFFIQHEVGGGWLLRGIHHFTADAMVIVMALHLLQMIIHGVYRMPNELVFWLSIVLFLLIVGTALTGYLLPWDQHGYWGTRVRIGYLGLTPLIGPELQRLAIGGTELGNLSLTRFFALHAGLLPALIVVTLALLRRAKRRANADHGHQPSRLQPADQAWRDAVAFAAVMGFVLVLIFRGPLLGTDQPLGAGLGAPADASEPYAAARPEWYFLFLFRLLEFFPGAAEVWGAVILPGLVLAVVATMPFIGKWRLGHCFNLVFCGGLALGIAALTVLALTEDRADDAFQLARERADIEAARARDLAASPGGIPPSGALTLLRADPLLQGRKLFAQHCAACHRYDGHDGLGAVPEELQSASDLKGFASREWLAGLLSPDEVDSTNYFGATQFSNGRMVRFVKRKVAGFDEQQMENLRKGIIALSAGAGLPAQAALDSRDEELIREGRDLLGYELGCTDCHAYPEPDDLADAPTLVGYGTREWLIRFIGNPAHPLLYGDRNDRMPAYLEDQILDEQAVGLIANWLREDWYRPEANETGL